MNRETDINKSRHEPPPSSAHSATGSALPYVLALAVLFAMAYGGWTWWRVRQFDMERGQAIPAIGPPLTEFELTERSGDPFRSTDMRGKVWVASYFFSTCPGTCTQVAQNIEGLNTLPELTDVTWVSITCDPDNDTLEVLRNHADRFHADPDRWLFCRADLDYTKRVASGMKIQLSLKAHQDHVAVIDRAGKIRGYFDATSTMECQALRKLLLKCLDEKPPQDLAANGATKEKSS